MSGKKKREPATINLKDYEHSQYLKLLSDNSENLELKRNVELEAFDYLCKIKNVKKIFDDEKALVYLKCLGNYSSDSKTFDELNDADQQKFSKLIIGLLEDSFQKFKKDVKDYVEIIPDEDDDEEDEDEEEEDEEEEDEDEEEDEEENDEDEEEELEFMRAIGTLLVTYTVISTKFTTKMIQNRGLKILFEYLKVTLDKSLTLEDTESNVYLICNLMASTIFNLSKLKHLYVQEWKEFEALEILFNMAFRLKDERNLIDLHLILYGTMAFLFEEKDLDKLKDIQSVVRTFSNLVESCAYKVRKGAANRIEIKMHSGGDRLIKAVDSSDSDDEVGWNVIELLECLYRLSVSDAIKYDIYFHYNSKENLRDLIYYGNEFEKEYALKLLWQLCFEKRVAEDVKKDFKLYSLIKEVHEKKEPKELVQCCSGMIWLVDEKNKQQPVQSAPKLLANTVAPTSSRHIMISYNSKSKELCLNIKAALEKVGYKIWIDVENIHGSSLESMAKAIEESSLVLMCMTEKYKQSANCRLEAEYSVNQNKPIVPLIMEKGYKPDGWLGIILGSKIFIDFTKYEFDECFSRLLKELVQHCKVDEQMKVEVDEQAKITAQSNKEPAAIKVTAWNEQDVEKWLSEKKFDNKITELLKLCNGELLAQLNEMYQKTPEFYYTSLNQNGKIQLREILHFTNEMKKLFKK